LPQIAPQTEKAGREQQRHAAGHRRRAARAAAAAPSPFGDEPAADTKRGSRKLKMTTRTPGGCGQRSFSSVCHHGRLAGRREHRSRFGPCRRFPLAEPPRRAHLGSSPA
jgi:hypothetical protein